MKRFPVVAAFTAAIVLTAPTRAAPALPDASPAMWVVGDHDTIIYLFGTFHALDGKSDWFNDEVRTAFDSSGELMLEALVPENPAELRPLLMKHLAPSTSGPPVIGAPVFAERGSFLGSTRQVMAAGRSAGLSVDRGADAVLHRAARLSGKRVAGLETVEFQLGMMGQMPGAAASAAPSPGATAEISSALQRMQRAWNEGDSDSFVPVLDAMRAQSPGNYQTLFVERNARWAEWIAARLTTPGTVFVAVGSGHLAGRDSVQRKLERYGIKSARIS